MTKEQVCPLMSARTTRVDSAPLDPSKPPTITPVVAKCQREDCALWDSAESMCAVLSIAVQLVKLGENNV